MFIRRWVISPTQLYPHVGHFLLFVVLLYLAGTRWMGPNWRLQSFGKTLSDHLHLHLIRLPQRLLALGRTECYGDLAGVVDAAFVGTYRVGHCIRMADPSP